MCSHYNACIFILDPMLNLWELHVDQGEAARERTAQTLLLPPPIYYILPSPLPSYLHPTTHPSQHLWPPPPFPSQPFYSCMYPPTPPQSRAHLSSLKTATRNGWHAGTSYHCRTSGSTAWSLAMSWWSWGQHSKSLLYLKRYSYWET